MRKSFLLVAMVLLMVPSFVLAQASMSPNGVNLNVNVVERKPTDTMNDFTSPTFSTQTGGQGQVLGAQTERQTQPRSRLQPELVVMIAGFSSPFIPLLPLYIMKII